MCDVPFFFLSAIVIQFSTRIPPGKLCIELSKTRKYQPVSYGMLLRWHVSRPTSIIAYSVRDDRTQITHNTHR